MIIPRFPLVFALFLILFLGILWASYKTFFYFNDSDKQEYLELIAQSDPNKAVQAIPYTAKQDHKKVQKEIWYVKDGLRLQVHISSADAALILDRDDEKTEVIEQMQDVLCTIQEELYGILSDGREVIKLANGTLILRGDNRENASLIITAENPIPMQIIRKLEAEQATYHYQTNRLIAHNVKVSRYVALGSTLEDLQDEMKPLMHGTADSIEIQLTDAGPRFTAQQLKATLQTSKGLP